MVVPGNQDVSQAACRGYFHTCEADEIPPQPPYWPKWRHYTRLFRGLYEGLDTVFDSDQPWTLFPVPELHTVVAGFNSSIAASHRPDDQYGFLGRDQAAWFAEALRGYEEEGWLRIGALRHPLTGRRRPQDAPGGPGTLRDVDTFTRLAAPRLHFVLHGPSGGPAPPAASRPTTICRSTTAACRCTVRPPRRVRAAARHGRRRHPLDRRRRHRTCRLPVSWHGAGRIFGTPDEPAAPPATAPPADNRAVDEPADSLAERVRRSAAPGRKASASATSPAAPPTTSPRSWSPGATRASSASSASPSTPAPPPTPNSTGSSPRHTPPTPAPRPSWSTTARRPNSPCANAPGAAASASAASWSSRACSTCAATSPPRPPG
ncbi:hypothetical protein O1L55_11300 [Streptomyces albulus]|nr:hypothetical protein [Streptomyces noursei]